MGVAKRFLFQIMLHYLVYQSTKFHVIISENSRDILKTVKTVFYAKKLLKKIRFFLWNTRPTESSSKWILWNIILWNAIIRKRLDVFKWVFHHMIERNVGYKAHNFWLCCRRALSVKKSHLYFKALYFPLY